KSGASFAPIVVKNGKAYVSGPRAKKFKLAQQISETGRIISVSNKIDLDTGMFVVRTSSPDGSMFVEIQHTGVFVPISAITSDNNVMISAQGVARATPVSIIATDSDTAVISGVADGDIIILTNVEDGMKVRIDNRY
ncbi:MAG: hypothetical protein FWG18_01890, partial [Alphaproteobacteria bacterium]|nr:hypothetical protein [Alphaproteobacteria bacterium]